MTSDLYLFLYDWANLILNNVVFNEDFVTGNSIVFTIDGTAVTAVPFDTDQQTTMNNIKTQIETDITGSSVSIIGSTLRRMLVTVNDSVPLSISVVVTGGTTQPQATIAYASALGESATIQVIRSHDNAPAPTGRYIAIGFSPNQMKVGSSWGGDSDSEGQRDLINDYNTTQELWEVNGNGDLLRMLINSADRQDIKELWYANNFSLMQDGEIRNMSRLEENEWIEEFMVELTINYATSTVEEEAGIIEEVEYEGTVEAQGRSGDHIVTNT